MAKIVSYPTANGRRWRVRYRTPEGRQTDKRGFRHKRDAEQWAATLEVSKARGEYVNPSDARRTVDSLGPDWLARQRGHLKPSSFRPLEVAWRLRVQPRWGAVALGDIRPSAIQGWLNDLGTGMGRRRSVREPTGFGTAQAGIAEFRESPLWRFGQCLGVGVWPYDPWKLLTGFRVGAGHGWS